MGMLNSRGVGMSGAVTSATSVATAVAETSARTMSVPSAWPGSIALSPQATSSKTDANEQNSVLNGLRTTVKCLLKGVFTGVMFCAPGGWFAGPGARSQLLKKQAVSSSASGRGLLRERCYGGRDSLSLHILPQVAGGAKNARRGYQDAHATKDRSHGRFVPVCRRRVAAGGVRHASVGPEFPRAADAAEGDQRHGHGADGRDAGSRVRRVQSERLPAPQHAARGGARSRGNALRRCADRP